MIPKFSTQASLARDNPLLQECYKALRDVKALCDKGWHVDDFNNDVSSDEIWAALEPLRKLVFEIDGTAFAEKCDSMGEGEMLKAVLAHDEKMRQEIRLIATGEGA